MSMRRHRIAALVLVIAAGLAVLLTVRSAQPRRLGYVTGQIMSPPVGTAAPARAGWVAWIEEDYLGGGGAALHPECRLMAARWPSRRARPALTAPTLAGLAVFGDVAFVGQPEGPNTQLLRLRLPSGSPELVASTHGPVAQIVASKDWLCWREHRPAGLPGVPFVVAGAPINVIRACPPSGLPGQEGQVALVTPLTGSVELLGVSGSEVYWLERRGDGLPAQGRHASGPAGASATTVIRRTPLPQGEPETLVTEAGSRTAALSGDSLVWTAPSLEAGDPGQFCAVKRRLLTGGETTVIGDWLDPHCVVLASAGGVYAQDRYHLWRLGSQRPDQRALYVVSSALSNSSIIGDEQYTVLGTTGTQSIAARPLTWWARVRRALQP